MYCENGWSKKDESNGYMTANELSTIGIRKAAILLSVLEEPAAEALLAQLEPAEATAIRQAVAELGKVAEEERRQVLDDFHRVRPLVPQASLAGLDLSAEPPKESPPAESHPAVCHPAPPLTFDELEFSDHQTLLDIVQSVDSRVLPVALLGAKPILVERLLACLPPAVAKAVRKKLITPDPIRLSEVEEARRRLVAAARSRNLVSGSKSAA